MHITVFIAEYGQGGVERMLINTARGLAARGHRVDYLAPADGAFLSNLGDEVRLEALPAGRRRCRQALHEHLQRARPDFVLVGKDKDAANAAAAIHRSGSSAKLVIRPGTTVSARLERVNPLKRWRLRRGIRKTYRHAAGIVANSQGVREDIARLLGRPANEVFLIRNPVVTPEFAQHAQAAVGHPWFADGGPPVLLGVGNLRRVKDFSTLIEAFARVRQQQPARLVILGRGHLREELLMLAERLGVAADVDLPGFVDNPYPLLRRAAAFVLSSIREGSPNALTEALALGTPVVATDCPSGPREILQGGRYGPLVPVQQPAALAEAIGQTLANPLPAATLREAAADYTMERNAEAYEEMLRALL